MVSTETFTRIVLSFEGTEQKPHFNRTAFYVTGRKIFATLLEKAGTANLFLSKADQAVYCSFNEAAVYPVANNFGLQGWTTFELASVPLELVTDALLTAYRYVLQTTPKKRKVK